MEKNNLEIIEDVSVKEEVEPEVVDRIPINGMKPVKKKSMLGRIISLTFGTVDFNRLGDDLMNQIIIPNGKNVVATVLKATIDHIIFETPITGSGGYVSGQTGRKDYSAFSSDNKRQSKSGRAIYYPGDADVDFMSRQEAIYVRDELIKEVNYRGYVKVAHLNEISGLPTKPADNRFGWDNLNEKNVVINEGRGVYTLRMPVPKPLNL